MQQRARYRLRRLIERRAAEVVAQLRRGFLDAPLAQTSCGGAVQAIADRSE